MKTSRRANTRWPTGTEVVIINVPKNSDIDGLHARVMGHKNQRLLLQPIGACENAHLTKILSTYGVAWHQVCRPHEIIDTHQADHDAYEGKAVFDPAAANTIVPDAKYLVPGSVRKLDGPIYMRGYSKKGGGVS